MKKKPIEKMDVVELRTEVQRLRGVEIRAGVRQKMLQDILVNLVDIADTAQKAALAAKEKP